MPPLSRVVLNPDGAVLNPDGAVLNPDGAVLNPDASSLTVYESTRDLRPCAAQIRAPRADPARRVQRSRPAAAGRGQRRLPRHDPLVEHGGPQGLHGEHAGVPGPFGGRRALRGAGAARVVCRSAAGGRQPRQRCARVALHRECRARVDRGRTRALRGPRRPCHLRPDEADRAPRQPRSPLPLRYWFGLLQVSTRAVRML